MPSPRHILFVSHTAGLAGAERAMAETMQGLADVGYTVSLIVPEDGPLLAFTANACTQQGTARLDHWTGTGNLTGWQKLKFLRGFWRSAKAIASQAKAWSVDAIVTNTSVFPSAALAAWMARLPHIWYLHEFVTEDHGLMWQYGERRSYRFIHRFSDAIVVNSLAMQQKVARFIPRDKTTMLYYACQIGWPARLDVFGRGELRLLIVGAIAEGKNQMLGLKSLTLLSAKGVRPTLVLVGNPTPAYLETLRKYSKEHSLDNQLVIEPFRADAGSAYAAGDILLLTSRSEAFGRVVVEGQKTGLPVILAAAGAGPELVRDGETGYLYMPGNAQALADAIQNALTDPARLAIIAEAGRAEAENRFNIERHIADFTAVLNALPHHG